MTPNQKNALESLIGRGLTESEIAQIDPLVIDPDNRNDVGIATILSVGRTVLGQLPKEVFRRWAASTGVRAVIEDHALDAASPLRSIALTLRDVLWSNTPSIDFAITENQQLLQAWVTANAITQEQANALLQFATTPNPIPVGEVSEALNLAEGRITFNQFYNGGVA